MKDIFMNNREMEAYKILIYSLFIWGIFDLISIYVIELFENYTVLNKNISWFCIFMILLSIVLLFGEEKFVQGMHSMDENTDKNRSIFSDIVCYSILSNIAGIFIFIYLIYSYIIT